MQGNCLRSARVCLFYRKLQEFSCPVAIRGRREVALLLTIEEPP